ncbi:MAG: hypothetical protein AAF290_10735 [Pseudomonadota bacterium]
MSQLPNNREDKAMDMLEDYINGHLSDDDAHFMQQRIAEDAELAAQFDFQRRLQQALRAEADQVAEVTAADADGRFQFASVAARLQEPRRRPRMPVFWAVGATCAAVMLMMSPVVQDRFGGDDKPTVNEFETAFDTGQTAGGQQLHVLLRTPLPEHERDVLLRDMGLRLEYVEQGGTLLVVTAINTENELQAIANALDARDVVIGTTVVGKPE